MQKKSFYRPTLFFGGAVTGNKQFIFLGLIRVTDPERGDTAA